MPTTSITCHYTKPYAYNRKSFRKNGLEQLLACKRVDA